ncbi:MAG: hypothetical protein LBE97_00085 [Holosporales bacterium]|jgi:hypothetical protein|nr:hypothetical protein [Holosporales bacterium]
MKKLSMLWFLTLAGVGANLSYAGVDPTTEKEGYAVSQWDKDTLKTSGQRFCVYCGRIYMVPEMALQCPDRAKGQSHSNKPDPNGVKKESHKCAYCGKVLDVDETAGLIFYSQCPQRRDGFACSPTSDPQGLLRVDIQKDDSGKDRTAKLKKKKLREAPPPPEADVHGDVPHGFRKVLIPALVPIDE